MSTSRTVVVVTVLVAAVVLWLSVFVVTERQKAILFRLGEIVRSDYEPGMHFMVPVLNNVQKFDRRILTLDSKPEQILTGEKKNVLVDYFVKWRIEDVESFYRSFGGREADAASRMAQIIKDALQAELGNRTIREVVAGERQEIMDAVTERSRELLQAYGIDVLDVRIKRTDLPAENARSIYGRMKAERERQAKQYRSEGQEASAKIKANADKERAIILADARKQAEIIRGEGDAQATKIYAESLGQSPDFYEFTRSLDAYRRGFDKNTRFILTPKSPFLKHLR